MNISTSRLILPLLLAALALPFGSTVQAATIYENYGVGGPDLANGSRSDFDDAAPRQVADDFELQPGASTLEDLHWWGLYTTSGPLDADNFSVRIYSDGGLGKPVVAPDILQLDFNGAANRTATGDSVFGFDIYTYSLDISALVLTAGTTYWLSIVNETTAATGYDWYWSTADELAGNGVFRNEDALSNGVWFAENRELAFYLTGPGAPPSVPVPGTLLLVGPALLLLGRRRRAAATV